MIIPFVWDKFKQVAWFLPGFCLYAAFPPMGEGMDVLFALAPLMWLARRGDPKESVKRWTQSGAFFWLATLSWMPAIVKNGGPWPLVLLGWFALAAYCTLYFAAYGYLSASYWKWAKNFHSTPTLYTFLRIAGILFVEPILWCGLELVRSNFGGGFAWNQLGVVPANFGFGAPAAIGGVYLLSAVVLLINGSIAGIIERAVASIKREKVNRLRSLETLLVFAVIFLLYKLPSREATSESSGEVKVVLVQRNFPCCFSTEERENPVEVYTNLLANVSYLKPDLVVLPESAMSEFGSALSPRAYSAANLLKKLTGAKAVLAGCGYRDKEGEYNSAALYGDEIELYNKVHLVPFGEFIPGDKLIPALQKLAPVGSCTPGKPALLNLHLDSTPIPFATAICYEDTDSGLIRDFAKKGARFLCFITNDSWFSQSNEALAHAWQATARSIETGLSVVRVGNSGVTGVIEPTGRRTYLTDEYGKVLVDEKGVMLDRIHLSAPTPTPYTRVGDLPLAILFALLILAMILVKYYSNHQLRGIPLNE